MENESIGEEILIRRNDEKWKSVLTERCSNVILNILLFSKEMSFTRWSVLLFEVEG